jgi:hypothetical protein
MNYELSFDEIWGNISDFSRMSEEDHKNIP